MCVMSEEIRADDEAADETVAVVATEESETGDTTE